VSHRGRAAPVPVVERWYVSCPRFTVSVETRDAVIYDGPPLVRRFRGQPLMSLCAWAGLGLVVVRLR